LEKKYVGGVKKKYWGENDAAWLGVWGKKGEECGQKKKNPGKQTKAIGHWKF